LNNRLDELNSKLRDTKIGTEEFKNLQKEISEVEKELF
jgi:hypothetical protein